ncbi:MAG: ABC transporter ATP-binding protein [Ndongobacter sp.]|nr:ABC transporter ATP-binding protein [Ndongobacter sp.]
MNCIELNNVVKRYKSFTLGPLTFQIPMGCIVGYIGENGAGKSTTIKLLLGLVHPDQGDIRLFEQDARKNIPDLHDRIGFVFDELTLPNDLRIHQAEKMCRLFYRHWESDTFHRYLEHFSLSPSSAVKTLSRGMKMKLSLAIALSHRAELLLFDEATSGLDPVVRDEILDILLEYVQDETHTVLISSHILSDLEKIADYVAFLHKGRLLFMESKETLGEKYALCFVTDAAARAAIDPKAILGSRKSSFGEELLVERALMPSSAGLTRPSIEEIMIYLLKGEQK